MVRATFLHNQPHSLLAPLGKSRRAVVGHSPSVLVVESQVLRSQLDGAGLLLSCKDEARVTSLDPPSRY
ncbi:MAG: hypothetical protein FRX48_08800 [Lasallia pustulata]|uniref:Uncharacterized protein n=1 Tax=Lasallia pustulata TaxID=136370 RepID=A0A5M8PDY7_9LECA|nr:MAG: hypothetical protein FRX48_08800 [Lasallia pustulata]